MAGWKFYIDHRSGVPLCRPIYGGPAFLKWPTSVLLVLHHRRAVRLFFTMRSMGEYVLEIGYLFVRRLRARYMSPFLLSHRLVLLVWRDGGGISEITSCVYVQFYSRRW